MNNSLSQYYRCPEQYISLSVKEPSSRESGFFRFGQDVLYGKVFGDGLASSPDHSLRDVLLDCSNGNGSVCLPFDAMEVLESLRHESYAGPSADRHPAASFLGWSYYFIRPLLSVKLRRHLQRIRLNGWRHLTFPRWPVDRTVESTLETLLLLSLRATKRSEIPFIWFWPDGATSCAIMTHDVETSLGRDFSSTLMDMNDAYGIKASFQVVPERRYQVPSSYLDSIRKRGFEVNVQDLNHDGHLFRDRQEFLLRAEKINEYGRQFKAEGFRSAVLYRRQEWYDALEFSYDMSVPNVAHLDPQRGGCCTVMPYFVGDLVELPVTMTQDYSLFHILEDHSLDLWKQQTEMITAKHGLMNFIIHPDYIVEREERATYENLLGFLVDLRTAKNVWIPLPREVASWWRERAQLKLIRANGDWRIEGKGKERARVAYASEKEGQLVYSFESKNRNSDTPELGAKDIAHVF